MTMMPCEVVTAHDEYSLCPRKYRLSNTFAGSTCHDSRGGGPGWRGGAGVEERCGDVSWPHVTLNTPMCPLRATFRAASMCTCAALFGGGAWAAAIVELVPAVRTPVRNLRNLELFMSRL